MQIAGIPQIYIFLFPSRGNINHLLHFAITCGSQPLVVLATTRGIVDFARTTRCGFFFKVGIYIDVDTLKRKLLIPLRLLYTNAIF